MRLSPPLARADGVAKLRLDHRDEVLTAERAHVGAEGLEFVERRRLVGTVMRERRAMGRTAILCNLYHVPVIPSKLWTRHCETA